MRHGFAWAAVGMSVLMLAQGAGAGSKINVQFRDSVRTLENVQDLTARGDQSAADLQSKLLLQIESDLKHAEKSDLQDTRNLRAMAIYLFSGGNPDAAERRLITLKMAAGDKNLLDGALAYARSDKANAIRHLSAVFPADLPANLGGRVALVKSILSSEENLHASLAMLDTARALMPGTLVEEAALRRCISFAGMLSEIAELERCASLYIRRYANSVYWLEFEESLITSVVQVDYGKPGRSLQNLNAVLEDLRPDLHRKMLLSISRAAVNHGRFSTALACAQKANDMSRADSLDKAKANLYLTATLISQSDFELGLGKLAAIDGTAFAGDDQILFQKVWKLVEQITANPLMNKNQVIQSLTPEEITDGAEPVYLSLLARAEKALADPASEKF